MKLLKIFLLLLSLLMVSSYASPFGNKLVVPIVEMDSALASSGDHIGYVPAFDLKVGESGEVLRWFSSNRSGIIGKAVVLEVKNNKAKILIERFTGLDQSAFPVATLQPEKDDEVIFRAFNDRAFLISPSQNIYEKVRSAYPDVTWLHPDLFIAHLLDVNQLSPSMKDFRKICYQYSAGVIYLVTKTEGLVLDCQTFGKLKHDVISGQAPAKERMRPFYSRIGNLDRSWFAYVVGDLVVNDYYVYYQALLDGKIPDQDNTFFGRASRLLNSLL